ncbi:MAG: hypothetical protein ACI9MC_000720 [Kiritimatiellia bacterium]|jgi:hypothetical protein
MLRTLLITVTLLVNTQAGAAEMDRLPLSTMRSIAAQVELGEAQMDRQRAVTRRTLGQLQEQARSVEVTWRRHCQGYRTPAGCDRVQANHRSLRARSLRVHADAWRSEAQWHDEVQVIWDRAARRSLGQTVPSRPVRAAERSLLGQRDVTRRAQAYLYELEALRAGVQRRLDDAARSAGITEPVSLALARRAAQSRLLSRELWKGAEVLDALALMVERGAGVERSDLDQLARVPAALPVHRTNGAPAPAPVYRSTRQSQPAQRGSSCGRS